VANIDVNRWVEAVLNDFTKSVPDDFLYFVLGSVPLISYTKDIGYQRSIKDIDIIADASKFSSVKKNLDNLGYKQGTFIDKKMPFYKYLNKLAEKKYFRFYKEDKNLEIMTSDIEIINDQINFEIYPGIKFSFPLSGINKIRFGKTVIKAVIPEVLYCIYSFGLKTYGRFVKTNIDQRKKDLYFLSKIVDKKKLNLVVSQICLHLGGIKIRIPRITII